MNNIENGWEWEYVGLAIYDDDTNHSLMAYIYHYKYL